MERKTYKDLKEFLSTLTDDQLNQEVVIEIVDNSVYRNVFFGVVDEDMYVYDGDNEDIGTLKILKECHEEDFDQSLCDLVTTKGSVFIGADN